MIAPLQKAHLTLNGDIVFDVVNGDIFDVFKGARLFELEFK